MCGAVVAAVLCSIGVAIPNALVRTDTVLCEISNYVVVDNNNKELQILNMKRESFNICSEFKNTCIQVVIIMTVLKLGQISIRNLPIILIMDWLIDRLRDSTSIYNSYSL